MIGLDTNVVVRYLVGDDPVQSTLAVAFVNRLTPTSPGFLSLVVLVETYWVLRRAYRIPVDESLAALERLVDADEVRVDRSDLVRSALASARQGADLADALIVEIGRAAGVDRTVTFDRRAVLLDGMALLDGTALGEEPPSAAQ